MSSLDQDFKDNGRPQSVVAQRFSMILDSAFGLDEFSETIQKKKEEVASQNAELEELEARLKAMEEQLKVKKVGTVAEPSGHSRSRSVSQKPYLRGPIAVSVRPQTPIAEQSKPAPAPAQTQSRLAPVQPPKRLLSFRRRQRRAATPSDDESNEDSDGSDNGKTAESQSSNSSDEHRKA